MLYETKVQRKFSQDEVLSIAEEASKEEVIWLRRNAELLSLNENETSVEKIVS